MLLRHEAHPRGIGADWFLCSVLRGSATATIEALRWSCRFLTDLGSGPGRDPQAALAGRHTRLKEQLRRAEHVGKLWAASNMETLMAQGMREPHLDVNELSAELRTVDAVFRAVYGVPPDAGSAQGVEDLGAFDGEDGVRRLLDIWNSE